MTTWTPARRAAATAALIATATLAAGCANDLLKSDQPAPETFRLAVPAAAAGTANSTAAASALALAVARPRAAAALDTDRIAVSAAGSRFDYYAGARWAESVPQMFQESLVAALAGTSWFGGGVFAGPTRVPAELLLDVELRRFEAVSAGEDTAPVVHVQAQASLVDTRRGVRVTSFVSESAVAASENRLQAVIAAYASASAQVILDINARVQGAAAALPAR